jgi:dihydrofolate reductase
MLPEARVFIATSLDGQIARADGTIDWLPSPDPADDYGYAEFMAGVDALAVGRHTF